MTTKEEYELEIRKLREENIFLREQLNSPEKQLERKMAEKMMEMID